MWLYFVRHGQSTGNLELKHSTHEMPLTPLGEEQAVKIAERLKEFDLSELWSSPMVRALQTAEVINQYHHLAIEKIDELREIRRASVFQGKRYDDPSIAELRAKVRLREDSDPHYKFQDSESYAEVVGRARGFLRLAERKAAQVPTEATIAVVGHGIMVSTILLCAILGDKAPPAQLQYAQQRMRIENTGISVLRRVEDEWRLVTMNDFAHL